MGSAGQTVAGEPRSGLAVLVRSHKGEILSEWERDVRSIPRTRNLDRRELIDHLPELLEQIARMTEQLARGELPELPRPSAEDHAVHRLHEGFDLVAVVHEYGVLRQAIVRIWSRSQAPMPLEEVQLLDAAIDKSIAASVEQYTAARDRTLIALDRISTEALESRNLDELLERLLHAFRTLTAAVDSASILIREGDVLRLRAGLEREVEAGFTVRIGEGFAGAIAAAAKPLAIRDASTDPTIKSSFLREAGFHALYGVPLMIEGDVIGVANMASRTAHEFSLQDQRLFGAMTARATIAIYQHMVKERADRTNAQLLEYERQFRVLADNIPQLAWMADSTGQVYWYNQRWFDYTGRTLDEMRGWGWESVPHPEYRQQVVDSFRVSIERGTIWEHTFPLLGKDGRYRWFLTRALPVRDEHGTIERWFGTNTDVTNQRFLDRATALMTRTLDYERTLQQLADLAVPDVADICIIDLREADVVRRVAIAHADPAKQALAREYSRKFPADLREGAALHGVIIGGETVLVEEISHALLERLARSPEQLHFLEQLGPRSWLAVPVIVSGQPVGAISMLTSESDRRYSLTDLTVMKDLGHRAGIAIENARLHKESRDAVRAREDVLAIVSHDLRNPLSAIDLGASLLLSSVGSEPRARKHLEAIRRSASRMEHLIDDLLDMASINAGKLAIRPTREDAKRLLTEVIDAHEPLASERGIALERDVEQLAGVILDCDRNRMAQALGNLLGNAVKFCRPGDVVSIRARPVDQEVRIEIADTGPGIAEQALPHIFEPYWSGRREKKTGTGLGLFITKAIIEAHNGTLSVASVEGHGATFTIALPRAP